MVYIVLQFKTIKVIYDEIKFISPYACLFVHAVRILRKVNTVIMHELICMIRMHHYLMA